LIAAAILAVYIVLGVLYESYVHPITILSTIPSAGIGALLALMLFGYDLGVISLIGIILLIGIVKKNAIMMVDVALDSERRERMSSEAAIRYACHLRFRPIMMTTGAAILGALPLALGTGAGSEVRAPLVGGDRRRTVVFAVPDFVYDSGGLSVHRPASTASRHASRSRTVARAVAQVLTSAIGADRPRLRLRSGSLCPARTRCPETALRARDSAANTPGRPGIGGETARRAGQPQARRRQSRIAQKNTDEQRSRYQRDAERANARGLPEDQDGTIRGSAVSNAHRRQQPHRDDRRGNRHRDPTGASARSRKAGDREQASGAERGAKGFLGPEHRHRQVAQQRRA